MGFADIFSQWFANPADPLLRAADVEQLAARHSFSQYLCYETYDEQRREYGNAGGTVGYIWECRPLAFLTDKSLECLAGLLRQDYPDKTTVQFILVPDDALDGHLNAYLALKQRQEPIVQQGAAQYARHLHEGRRGLAGMGGTPVRNFRLLVAIKSPAAFQDDRIKWIEEMLTQGGLAPAALPPAGFLDLMRRLLNSAAPVNTAAYDPGVYLSKQIVQAETRIRVEEDHIRIGSRYAACLTPKSMPASGQLDCLGINALIGGYGGPQDDGSQIAQRFVWTTTVFFETRPADIRRKASVMAAQRVGGTIAKDLARRNAEMSHDLEELEQDRFVDLITSVWVFGEDREALNRGIARCRGLWEQQRFVMQRESHIGIAMLLVALPFGLYLTKNNVVMLQRHFTMSARAAAHLLPVQADFGGRMRPAQLYVGRKGQLVSVDVFDKRANNHNFLVCAGSGAGKSFLMNKLVGDYYGLGSLIRIVDIGYSYEKQTMLLGGRYIDIGEEAGRLCLNPFTTAAAGARHEAESDELAISSVLLTMAFAATEIPRSENSYYTLMKDAVRFAKARDGGERGVDHVAEYLRTFPKHAADQYFDGAIPLAHQMAFNLRDFTSSGKHGALFNGKSTLNIGADDFVVLELERIMNDTELFQVIAMQVVNAITQDLYLSDRSQQRFMVFDEAWRYFSSTPMIANMIKEGYRRARKYGGATGIITQSPLDLRAFGEAGVVIKSNSAFKFFLESQDYNAAVAAGILDYQGLLLDLAKSVRNMPPRYSEVLFDTPFGAGVARLCADRFTYWMNTTTASEVARFKYVLSQVRDPVVAIRTLVEEDMGMSAGRAA
jgi:conjugal transfer ATP-binding protein TraC